MQPFKEHPRGLEAYEERYKIYLNKTFNVKSKSMCLTMRKKNIKRIFVTVCQEVVHRSIIDFVNVSTLSCLTKH